MMVLAMHIIGDRPPNSHELRPWCYGENPASRNDQALDVPKENASLADDATRVVIECDEMV
jgi:hypothetical protein